MEKIVLIISTDATRTGVPVLLLNNLRWLKKNSDLKFVLLLQHSGALLPQYKELADVYVWNDIVKPELRFNSLQFFFFRIYRKLFNLTESAFGNRFVSRLLKRYQVQLIFSNSATNGNILSFLKNRVNTKVLTYVHEGEKILDLYNKQGHVSYNIAHTDFFAAVSESAKQAIVKKFDVSKEIKVIPGGIDTQVKYKEDNLQLAQFGVPSDAVVIMTCGWMGWHKGMDFFIQIARKLSAYKQKHLHFIWLGGNDHDEERQQMKFDIEKLNLSNHITLISSRPNPLSYMDKADIFLMLSRNESFSLVTAEAALVGKPVLCFDLSGGPVEIVNSDARFIVPYANIEAICDRILHLVEHKGERQQMGAFLRDRVLNNYSVENASSSLLGLIKNMIDQ